MSSPGPSSQPDRKRPRIELDAEGAEEKALTEHTTLYLEDGNVIFSTGATLFRVHRSVLCKHSQVFRDMFEHKHDTLRGCVHIAVDHTREEMEALLNLVYNGLRVDIEEVTIETFPTLANILRMATRYQIERPREEVIALFRDTWPSQLAQHDAQSSGNAAPNIVARLDNRGHVHAPVVQAAAPPPPHPGLQMMHPMQNMAGPLPPGGGPPDGWNVHRLHMHHHPHHPHTHNINRAPGFQLQQEPIAAPANIPPPQAAAPAANAPQDDALIPPAAVIALLRKCGYTDPNLLFPLFYALSCTTWQFGGGALGHNLSPLSPEDVERFVVGTERLRARHALCAVTIPKPTGPEVAMMPPSHVCPTLTNHWVRVAQALLGGAGQDVANRARRPLEEWREVATAMNSGQGALSNHGMCNACARGVSRRIETIRAQLWDALPGWFELR